MTRQLKAALKKQKKQTKREVLQIPGSLGIPIGGQRRVEVPTRNSFVYVRLRDNENEVIQAFNNKVAPSYGLPVIVERKGNRYFIVSVDDLRYQNNWNSFSPYLPRHGNTHSFDLETGGGGDITWVHTRQFMPALIMPSGSTGGPNVIMNAYTLKNEDGTWKYIGVTGTPNLMPYIPTVGNQAVMALIYLDTLSGNPYLMVGSGSYFSNTITGSSQIVPYIPPLTNPDHIPLAAVRLVTGTNSISWNNIYDLRQFLRKGNTPSSENIYFLTSGSASVSTYDLMITSRPTGTYNYYSASISATGTLLGDWITEPNVPNASFISDGIYHLHIHAQKTAGTKDARLKYIFSKRASSGVETVLHVSELSNVVTSSESEFDIESLEPEHGLDTSDRLVARLYGFQEGLGTAPTVQIKVEGDTLSRFEIPAISSEVVAGSMFIQDEGVNQGSATTLNFVGNQVQATVAGGTATILITGSSGGVSNLTGTSIGQPTAVVMTSPTGTLVAQPWLRWGTQGGNPYVQFGANVPGQDGFAGLIGLRTFGSNYLEIVGAGSGSNARNVRILDNLDVGFINQGQYLKNSSFNSAWPYVDNTGLYVGPTNAAESLVITGSFQVLGMSNAGASVRFTLNNLLDDVGSAFLIPLNGWIPKGEVWTRVTNTQFTVSGDVTATYRKGTKVRYEILSSFGYSVIASSSHSAGTTTVNLIPTTDYGMPSSPTGRWLSYIENPEGFPAIFNFTTTITPNAGSLTSVTINQAIWSCIGNRIKIDVTYTLNNIGTGTGSTSFSTPVTSNGLYLGFGRESGVTGNMLQAIWSASTSIVGVLTYNNGGVIANGYSVIISIIGGF